MLERPLIGLIDSGGRLAAVSIVAFVVARAAIKKLELSIYLMCFTLIRRHHSEHLVMRDKAARLL